MENWYNFVTEVGIVLQAYVPTRKRKDLSYTEAKQNLARNCRGRYVEFNLVHDKGTLFGLKPTEELKVF